MSARLVPSLTAAWLLLVLTCDAEAHIPPPVYLNIEITDAHTDVVVVVALDVAADWFEVDPGLISEGAPVSEDVRAVLAARLAEWLRVQVDGRPAEGLLAEVELQRFEDHEQTWEYLGLTVRYATELPPRQVAIAWTHYASAAGWGILQIDAELEAHGETDYPQFKEREPEYVWHRPREVAAPAPAVLPKPVPPPTVALPLLSILLALLGLGTVVALRRRRLAWLGLPVALATAWLVSGVATVDVELPGEHRLVRPDDAEAIAVFASLHRGVYTASDGETESVRYESLAECVTGELLEALYLEINRSLILENEGGAIAKIQKTEIVEAEVLPDGEPDAAWFEVRARWRVEGKVGHWGHTHQRINEYLANVTIVGEAATRRWKIAEIEVLDESRIDDGRKVR